MVPQLPLAVANGLGSAIAAGAMASDTNVAATTSDRRRATNLRTAGRWLIVYDPLSTVVQLLEMIVELLRTGLVKYPPRFLMITARPFRS